MYGDWRGVKKLLGRAKAVCDAGGDWEHKNKLKVRAAGRWVGAGPRLDAAARQRWLRMELAQALLAAERAR